MSKIRNDGLTRSGTGCLLYCYTHMVGNSGRQRVKAPQKCSDLWCNVRGTLARRVNQQ